MKAKLKPCPFCGNIAKIIKSNMSNLYDMGCGTRGCLLEDGTGAEFLWNEADVFIDKWNTRIKLKENLIYKQKWDRLNEAIDEYKLTQDDNDLSHL